VSPLPRLAITLGDPNGIGPEVVGKALAMPSLYRYCQPVIVGDAIAFRRYKVSPADVRYRFVDVHTKGCTKIEPGKTTAIAGRAAHAAVVRAVELIRNGEADALVTAPLSKEALHRAGIRYPGHTELLAVLTGSKRYAMLMVAGSLRAVMATRHVALSRAGKALSVRRILDTTVLSHQSLQNTFRIPHPRIALCALNPHAGEGGLLGSEEQEIIQPALRCIHRRGIPADGPLPGDSAWQKMAAGNYDLLVTMYHDQAMIGLKCLAPEKIVNVTIGLPFIRTSPGHGTGFDIAGKNRADPRSMIEAIKLAAQLSPR
jgi:4-hydroxythreonine-4-phosphate dehydrogenase